MEEKILGQWGRMRRAYLMEHRPATFITMVMRGELFPHLAGGDKNETINKDQVKVLMQAAKKTGRQGEISDAMKKLGIAKFADVPVGRYQEIKELVDSFAASKPDAIEGGTETEAPPEPEAPPEEAPDQK